MNDGLLIGFTGKRGVGKSEAIKILVDLGFIASHAFEPGKVAAVAYYKHIGIDENTANRMVYGDLRDVPCEKLPDNATSRFFMEELGKFMGVRLGAEWTLGAEIRVLEEQFGKERNKVIDSVVYEEALFRRYGGKIIRITAPASTNSHIVGHHTDDFQEKITADEVVHNTLDGLDKFRESLIKALRTFKEV